MITIHKYPLEIVDRQRILMHAGKALSVGVDPRGTICLWAMVDDNTPGQTRTVAVVGTGGRVPHGYDYVGMVVSAPFVWHIFLEQDKVSQNVKTGV